MTGDSAAAAPIVALRDAIARNRPEWAMILFIWAYVVGALAIAEIHDMRWPIGAVLSSYWVLAPVCLFALVAALSFFGAKRGPERTGALYASALKALLFLSFIPFAVSFSQYKSVLHLYPGVNFDAELAALDAWMHGGDAWRVYAPALDILSFEASSYFYHGVWAAPIILGPALAIALDRDRARLRAALTAYLLVWAGLGNIVAGLVYSVGPVFYGPLVGDADRFADFFAFAGPLGFEESRYRLAADFLLHERLTGGSMTGAGISAFPSIHVAMAALTALYLGALNRWLWPLGLFYLAVIQLFSVLSGMHYAVDGYFCILAVPLIWLWLRRKVFPAGA